MTVSIIVKFLYLYVSCYSVYTIIQRTDYENCIYSIGTLMSFDLLLWSLGQIKLKREMVLHHVYVLGFIIYFMQHFDSAVKLFGQEICDDILRGLLSTEISTVFLTLRGMIKDGPLIFVYLNDLLFIYTFYYYRLNFFYRKFLIPYENFQIVILFVSKNNFWFIAMNSCIYGLYLLNVYWGTRIVEKMLRGMNELPMVENE